VSKSAERRSNRNARKIAALITLPLGACIAFGPTEARAFVLAMKIDVPPETNLSLLAHMLNKRMPKRFPGRARAFNPYADTFRSEYRQPNPDPGRPRREPPDRAIRDFADAENW
jgi:hypothetical protein